MAPRAIGLGVTQITFIVVTALASLLGTGAVSRLQLRVRPAPDPARDHRRAARHRRCCPTLSRDAAVGHEASFASLLTRALRLLIYVMVPIAVLTAVDPPAGGRDPVRERPDPPADLDLIAVTLTAFLVGLTAHAMIAVLARAFYARQDTVTPVVAAVGAVAINCTLAVVLVGPLGLPGHRAGDRDRGLDRGDRRCSRSCTGGCTTSRCAGLGRVGIESVVGSVVAGVVAYAVLELVRGLLGTEPGPARPDRRGGDRRARPSGRSTPLLSLALRIPELPSIVGVMVDVLRRPVRS